MREYVVLGGGDTLLNLLYWFSNRFCLRITFCMDLTQYVYFYTSNLLLFFRGTKPLWLSDE